MTEIRIALDKSARRYDQDGHLHVEVTNISKAVINPYYGREIPDGDKLGLQPDQIYQLLRDPDELEKAASTFNGKQLLTRHKPQTAGDHDHELTVGSVNNVRFEAPFLKGELVVWDAVAIAGIESNMQRELSCGYRYSADMTPGEYKGAKYDGVMRNIVGNHVALVEQGRAGPDVMVGDANPKALTTERRDELTGEQFAVPGKRKLPIENAKHAREAWDLLDDTDGLSPEEKAEARRRILSAAKKFDIDTSDWSKPHPGAHDHNQEFTSMAKANLSRQALLATGALRAYLPAKLAADAKIDLRPVFKGVTNIKAQKAGIVTRLKAATNGKLAADADLDDVVDMLDKLDDVTDELDDATQPPAAEDDDGDMMERLSEVLKAKGMSDEDVQAVLAAMKPEVDVPAAADAPGTPILKPAPQIKPAASVPAKKPEAETVTKAAMDAAIAAAVRGASATAEAATIARLNATREAEKFVRPWIGEIAIAQDTADGVFKLALDSLNVEVTGVHPSAYRAILAAQPKPNERVVTAKALAMDAKGNGDFAKRFPGALSLKQR